MIGLRDRGTYTRLLASLIIVVALTPFFNLIPGGKFLFQLAFVAVIFTAVWDIARTRRVLMIGITLGVPALAVRLTSMMADTHAPLLEGAVGGLGILFFSYIVFEIVRDITTSPDVSNDTIRGATCAYLLMGLAWASAYQLMTLVEPGSIDFGIGAQEIPEQSFTYYSFVVLTTLGFGDITPVSGLARSLTWIEAVTGQLFIATIIARLVGLRMRSGPDR
ncbi:MAG: two pore domain potassium channel family protein [Acidobacteria bacterium]|nr:two pore domain potassium channel family protein [Acidobacteriota bacterium]